MLLLGKLDSLFQHVYYIKDKLLVKILPLAFINNVIKIQYRSVYYRILRVQTPLPKCIFVNELQYSEIKIILNYKYPDS